MGFSLCPLMRGPDIAYKRGRGGTEAASKDCKAIFGRRQNSVLHDGGCLCTPPIFLLVYSSYLVRVVVVHFLRPRRLRHLKINAQDEEERTPARSGAVVQL